MFVLAAYLENVIILVMINILLSSEKGETQMGQYLKSSYQYYYWGGCDNAITQQTPQSNFLPCIIYHNWMLSNTWIQED